jgi:hypothetical protein
MGPHAVAAGRSQAPQPPAPVVVTYATCAVSPVVMSAVVGERVASNGQLKHSIPAPLVGGQNWRYLEGSRPGPLRLGLRRIFFLLSTCAPTWGGRRRGSHTNAAGPSRRVQRRAPSTAGQPSLWRLKRAEDSHVYGRAAADGERASHERPDGDLQRDGAALQAPVRTWSDRRPDTLGRPRPLALRARRYVHPGRAQPGRDGRAPATARHAHRFQYATVREFCDPVEGITGRTVRSFHSSID